MTGNGFAIAAMVLLGQLCTLGFATLTLVAVARPVPFPRAPYVLGLALTALWSLLASLDTQTGVAPMVVVAEGARNIAWLWFMAAIAGRREEGFRITPIGAIYVGLCAIQAVLLLLMFVAAVADFPIIEMGHRIDLLQMLFATGALVLLHNILDAGRPAERQALTLPLGAMAGLWAYDLNLYAIGYLSGQPASVLIDFRPLAVAMALLVFTLVAFRAPGKAVQLSRPVAFRSLGIAAIGVWLLLLAMFVSSANRSDSGLVGQFQLVLVALAAIAIGLFAVSARIRATLRVLVLKHFFEHRYDYRAEWRRFTATLHRPEQGGQSLGARVVKAIADIVESEGGVLVTPGASGFAVAAHWARGQMPSSPQADWDGIGKWLAREERIVQLTELRAGRGPGEERAAVDPALLAADDWWVIVPLIHLDELEGMVLLSPPLVARALDWEDFDLLKVAGRQAASLLAEARGADALAERERFEEFHRRFAFIMHDVKNLASQMGVLARNAERHGENPAFREDMIATLRVSADRLTQLMQRLQQQDQVRVTALLPVNVSALCLRVALAKRGQHAVDVVAADNLVARGDSDTLETLLGHLVQNAIDASPDDAPVRIEAMQGVDGCTIRVIDQGVGMTPEFIRTSLFRPFSSTKEGGFGIGAYQARQLAEAMQANLAVESRLGSGTIFTLQLSTAALQTSRESEAA